MMRNNFIEGNLATKKHHKYRFLFRVLLEHAEGWARVAALAVFEGDLAAEGALAVVTRETGRAACRDEVFRGRGRTHLASLWRASGSSMTVSARESLSDAVIRMAERVAIGARVGARGPVCFAIVTDSARCNLASGGGFARRRVTRVATVMCGEVSRDRQSEAAIDCRAVTARAASLRTRRAGHVLRVIKLHVERLIEACRKVFEWRIVAGDICVADGAHRDLRRCELAAMTISAGFVTRKARRG